MVCGWWQEPGFTIQQFIVKYSSPPLITITLPPSFLPSFITATYSHPHFLLSFILASFLPSVLPPSFFAFLLFLSFFYVWMYGCIMVYIRKEGMEGRTWQDGMEGIEGRKEGYGRKKGRKDIYIYIYKEGKKDIKGK
jgi:hypothetical protein